ncbi:hypothetical protein Nepgr_001578 [Nepenthes gracilis]|uniref:Uncharacterized protein n=1 Tax=Nepenthes gracilis TaxID=150966 RepID=A0AAD3P8G7_NEPGR|nr:hypothetical protein Nepgr_001578 [Nepenthes gracilis]
MRRFSLSFRLAIALSVTFTAASSSYLIFSSSSSFPFSLKSSFLSPPPPPPPHLPRATHSDLLSLLGPEDQARVIDPKEAQQLRSCFKFLVPFNGSSLDSKSDEYSIKRRFMVGKRQWKYGWQREEEENEMIWWPPAPVLDLARLAVDSGGDPDAIHRALDPTVIQVPDVDGSKENQCELTRTPYGRCFINEELNSYLASLFELIACRGPMVGLNISLSRFDLFHGHLFLATESGRLGILFHAKEYPAYDKEDFPYNMGYCQKGSNVAYDDSMNLRNILWLAPLPSNSSNTWLAPGVLVVLDAHPGESYIGISFLNTCILQGHCMKMISER